MTYRPLALLFATLISLFFSVAQQAAAQGATPDGTCESRDVRLIEVRRNEIEGYLTAPDAPKDIETQINDVIVEYARALSWADIPRALDTMTTDLVDHLGWGCDPQMIEVTPVATPFIREFSIEQVRLYDDETATAFLSLPDRVHDTTAGKVYDRVFFIVLERTDGVWKIDRIGTEILITDAESNEPAYLPALELRDHGMPEE